MRPLRCGLKGWHGTKQAASQRFAEITRANIGRQLAIVVDGRLLTAPRINSEILGGRGMITGSFSVKEAAELADKINAAVQASIDPTFEAAPTRQATDTLPVVTQFALKFRRIAQTP